MPRTPHTIAPPPPDIPPHTLTARFSLDPAVGLAVTDRSHTAVDGGWWPRSRNAATEIADLVTALTGQLGRIVRVAVDRADFDDIPRKISMNGRVVRVGWFDNLGHHVILTRGPQDQFLLLLIPPHTPSNTAQAALTTATNPPSTTPQHPHPNTTTNDPYQPNLDRWADDGAPNPPHHTRDTAPPPPDRSFTPLCAATAFLARHPRHNSAP